jgi:hypothetical protein
MAVEGFTTEHGVVLPLKIDCTDNDPTNGDEERTLLLQWGGTGSSENWRRPSQWGGLMVFDPNASGLAEESANIPLTTRLHDNYPNPFNPTTTIRFDLAKAGPVSIIIYNSIGQKVRTLLDAAKQAGKYDFVWDGRNDHGNRVGTGVYFFRMKADDYQMTRKMVMIK